MRADNRQHVLEAAARRGEQARARVIAVINQANQDGQCLSITQLARAASVSRAYIYSQRDLITAARSLQQKNTGRPAGTPTDQRASAASLLTRIEALTTRNKKLQDENRQLRRRLEIAYGQLRSENATGSRKVPP
ncbi:DUF6262 family protein [Agromyces sp. Soil535]|uniref:DUF6262 family protein n=1 Tax=Agromyces sp. Soil535 TaxID=1736390 RepID=UPI0006F4050F|nr:DUF6262 family protein [Agromyces sp. Soil535]KRE29588.1 hypothetical protein ASG80_19305 [Agromyces sp. Soil535]